MLKNLNISICGTGLMGTALGQKCCAAGVSVIAYNRTLEKTKPLESVGAQVVTAPQEAFERGNVILLVLSEKASIDGVLSQCEDPVFKGKSVLQMGTIAPDESQDLERFFGDRGARYLECPVLGSRKEAAAGTLILMAGGEPQVFEDVLDVLKLFASHPRYVGPVGKASTLKLAFNSLIISHVVGFSLSLGLAQKGGVDVGQFMEMLRESSLYASMIEKKLPRWMDNNYADPNFPVKHLLKDCNLIMEQMNAHEMSTDVLVAVHQLLENTMQLGLGEADYSAIYKTINNC
ncbi:NAD(P)-dependent oxidoreductase [Candidatus Omnitrophota bacterium]